MNADQGQRIGLSHSPEATDTVGNIEDNIKASMESDNNVGL